MSSPPAAVTIYDFNWFPEDKPNSPDPTGIEAKTQGSQRSHDTAAQDAAQQAPGAPHAPTKRVRRRPPPKLKNQGVWNYVQYIPEWTDPLYQEPQLEVEMGNDTNGQSNNSQGRIIRSYDVLKYMRPAQLPIDQTKNPTAFALRYGIFPGRTDGRSRLSPTRSKFRKFKVDGVQRDDITGEFVSNLAQEIAEKSGEADVDDLLKTYSQLDREAARQLPARDQFVLAAMQDMQEDEDWQSTLFRGLTTNDLSDQGILTFGNNYKTDLQNGLHRFFQRDKWGPTTWRGDEPDYPRLVYRAGDRRGEYDPGTDDYLWQRLQPALRLASRMMDHLDTMNHPFWVRMLDVFNREPISSLRDGRPGKQRAETPAYTFSMQDHNGVQYAQERREIDPVEATRFVLNDINLQIQSGDPGMDKEEPYAGMTRIEGSSRDIVVYMSAEAVWPLLVEGYTADEHMLTSYMFATTLLHEIAHAVNYAHFRWLVTPGLSILPNRPSPDPLALRMEDIGVSLFGDADAEDYLEPFFELETRTELGYCLENVLFGGANWPMISTSNLTAKYLYFLPSGMSLRQFPHGRSSQRRPNGVATGKDAASMILKKPALPAHTTHTCVKLSQIARLFSEDFWTTEVPRYGMAALQMRDDTPARLCPPADESYMHGMIIPSDLKKILEGWPVMPHVPLVDKFLSMVALEFLRAPATKFRWRRDEDSWTTRADLLFQRILHISLVGKELPLWNSLQEEAQNLDDDALSFWKNDRLIMYRDYFFRMDKKLTEIDLAFPRGSEALASDDTFWDGLRPAAETSGLRLNELLRMVHLDLVHETKILQDMCLDMYKLTDVQRESFRRNLVAAAFPNRAARIVEYTEAAQKVLERAIMDPQIKDDFTIKFAVLRAQVGQLENWSQDIRRICPANWGELITVIPSISKAKRTASMRLVKFAQREISLMPIADVNTIDQALMLMGQHVDAAGDVGFRKKRKFSEVMKEVEQEMEGAVGPGGAEEDDDGDVFMDPVPVQRPVERKRPKLVGTPSLMRPMMRHPQPFSTPAAPQIPKFTFSVPGGPVYPPTPFTKRGPAVPSTQGGFGAFANTPVTFPQAQPGESFLPAAPSAPSAPAPLVACGQRPGIGPLGLFPSAYALPANFTQDLMFEARVREEEARNNVQGPAVVTGPIQGWRHSSAGVMVPGRVVWSESPRPVQSVLPDPDDMELG